MKSNDLSLFSYLKKPENDKRLLGYNIIAGADEAGRGPLCGPVVAACVVLPSDCMISGINDSKKISEKKRNELYNQIVSGCIDFNVGIIGPEVIDDINILNATRLAFKKAVEGLSVKPDFLFTDAISGLELDIEYSSHIKGDATIYSVAAASIIAKVTRDRIMIEYDKIYPQYGFARNKGYGTKLHYEAIRDYGILPIHRKSFLGKIISKSK